MISWRALNVKNLITQLSLKITKPTLQRDNKGKKSTSTLPPTSLMTTAALSQ